MSSIMRQLLLSLFHCRRGDGQLKRKRLCHVWRECCDHNRFFRIQ
jgi:hypothetical protein